MGRVLGPQMGDFGATFTAGVVFLEDTPTGIDGNKVAQKAAACSGRLCGRQHRHALRTGLLKGGLALERSVGVTNYLESSVPGIFAAAT
jgi:hypothetical protein